MRTLKATACTYQEQVDRHLLLLISKRCLNGSTDTLRGVAQQRTPSSLAAAPRNTGVERSRSGVYSRQSVAIIRPQFPMRRGNHVKRD